MISIGELLEIILSELKITSEQKKEVKIIFFELFLLSIADQLSDTITLEERESLAIVVANAKNDPNRIDNLHTALDQTDIEKSEMEHILKNAASFSVQKIYHYLNQEPSENVADALHSLGR